MNKRIQELIAQATSKPHRVQGYGGAPTHIYPGHLDAEKLAELIVRECLAQNKLAFQLLKNNPENIPGYKTIMNLAQVSVRNQIVQHFGIEEI